MPLTGLGREPAGDSDSSLLYQGKVEASYLRRVVLKAASPPSPAKFTVLLCFARQGMASPRSASAPLTGPGREAMTPARRGEAMLLLLRPACATGTFYFAPTRFFALAATIPCRAHAKQQQHTGVKCFIPTGVHEVTN